LGDEWSEEVCEALRLARRLLAEKWSGKGFLLARQDASRIEQVPKP
jgi:hypothetical protein